jgi:hypothetical protein
MKAVEKKAEEESDNETECSLLPLKGHLIAEHNLPAQ